MVAERSIHSVTQRRQHLLAEPGIAPLPRRGAPGRVRQGEIPRQMRAEVAHLLGHRAAAQHVGQRVACPPAASGGSPASAPAAGRARAARIPGAAARRRRSAGDRGSKSPSARWRYGFHRRRCRGPSAARLRRRSPEGSLHERPVSCTLVPGAWLTISRRAVGGGAEHRARTERQMSGADAAGADFGGQRGKRRGPLPQPPPARGGGGSA